MDEIKKNRIESDKKNKVYKQAYDEVMKFRNIQDGLDKIASASWPKFLLGAFAVTAVALIFNIRWVNLIHFNSYLTKKKDNAMKRFRDKLDKEEIIFQNNLLNKFRKDKNMIVKKVTDDDLKNSKFFD